MEMNADKHEYVEVKSLPDFLELNAKIKQTVKDSSWFELYGIDWIQCSLAMLCLPLGLYILRCEGLQVWLIGVFLLSCYHTCLSSRAAHLAAHGALAHSQRWNFAWHMIFGEFIGSFSTKCGHEIHIKSHHPHTNIIGLGDSSTWKVPFLSAYVYMFLGPLALPALIPMVLFKLLVESHCWRHLAIFVVLFPTGIIFHLFLLLYVSNFSLSGALVSFYIYRAAFAIPYIHVNIFQHIGLPMYSPKDRPARIYQMASGCLNLQSNTLLNLNFGHSLVSCHVEHHLFPKLSDHMCLKVKPAVQSFLTQHGLPYHEESYTSRLTTFLAQYEKLMVNAPPITHLVGLQ